MHAHPYINGSSVMLSDPFPEHGCARQAPQGFTMTLMVDNIEVWWKPAIDAGDVPGMPPTDMFWGTAMHSCAIRSRLRGR
jgi:PhnB protein